MYIICFNTLKPITRKMSSDGSSDRKLRVCGAVQMTGFDGPKHTIRQDLPCRGCGAVGHYDGMSRKLEDNGHSTVVNGDVEPVRVL